MQLPLLENACQNLFVVSLKNTIGSSDYKMLNYAMKNEQKKMWKEAAVAQSTVLALH